jgi:hypothetical protein
MARWMINCRDYVKMVSGGMDRNLSFWERLSMKMHQIVCPACHEVKKQFSMIRNACRLLFPTDKNGLEDDAVKLSDDARLRIRTALKNLSR